MVGRGRGPGVVCRAMVLELSGCDKSSDNSVLPPNLGTQILKALEPPVSFVL